MTARYLLATLATLAVATAQPAPTPTVVRGFIAQIASGGTWKTTITLFNPTTLLTAAQINFRQSDGTPLTLPLTVTQGGARFTANSAQVERTLRPLATLVVEIEGAASEPTLTGWAEVVSLRRLAGSAIFRQQTPGARSNEAVAPLEYNLTPTVVIPFDNRQGLATGVALVNPSEVDSELVIRLRNENGIEIGLSRFRLRPNGHVAADLDTQFEAVNVAGTAEFFNPTGRRVVALGLRFPPAGGFTSIPSIPLTEPLPTEP